MIFIQRTYQKRLFSILIEEIRLKRIPHLKKPMGFTVIELMIVIAIVATLSAISVPIMANYIDRAKNTRAKAEIRTIEKEITSFLLENDRYPNDLSEIGLENFLDPYGNPYQYLYPTTYIDKKGEYKKSSHCRTDKMTVPINTDFDIYSMGKDGMSAPALTGEISRDDIIRANNGHFVGLASAY